MSLPIILVYGYRTRLQSAGWTARLCERCEKVQPFECFDQLRSEHIYFIHGKEHAVGRVLICDFCETGVALPAGGKAPPPGLSREWRRGDGVRALAAKTNPELGQVAESGEPTPKELAALLESANEQSNAVNVNVQPGIVRGGFAGAFGLALLAGALCALGLPPTSLDTFGNVALALTVGAIAGAVAGAFREQRRAGGGVVEAVLGGAMGKHGLSLRTLRRALEQHPRKLPRVARGLRALAAAAGEGGAEEGGPSRGASPRRNVCAQCQLVNFPSAAACKRCGASLQPSAA